ncbi:MAG: hypothetical protein EZS28_017805 [Streblomastix strix]|uniref:Uncharacterized protein n=1 Tax=Streblomastix strix TaxID=222440 RepID=A0A5J4VVV6_9EUKA|nr:MAG: hypothetical protein EZS28_017805 [Streblomastix strix]
MSRWAVATASPLKNKGPHSPLRDRATHARQAYSRSKNWYDGMPDVPDVNIAKRMYERNTNSAPNPLQPSITSPQRDYTPHISTPHTKQLMPPSSTATFDELQRVEELLSPNTRNSRLTRHQSPQQASFSPPPLLSHPIQDSDVIPYNIQQQQQQQSQSHIGPFRYTAQTVPHQVQYIRRMNSPPRTSPPSDPRSFTTANIIMQHSNSPTTKNSYSPPGFGEQQLQNMAQEAKQIQAKAEWDNQQKHIEEEANKIINRIFPTSVHSSSSSSSSFSSTSPSHSSISTVPLPFSYSYTHSPSYQFGTAKTQDVEGLNKRIERLETLVQDRVAEILGEKK